MITIYRTKCRKCGLQGVLCLDDEIETATYRVNGILSTFLRNYASCKRDIEDRKPPVSCLRCFRLCDAARIEEVHKGDA